MKLDSCVGKSYIRKVSPSVFEAASKLASKLDWKMELQLAEKGNSRRKKILPLFWSSLTASFTGNEV